MTMQHASYYRCTISTWKGVSWAPRCIFTPTEDKQWISGQITIRFSTVSIRSWVRQQTAWRPPATGCHIVGVARGGVASEECVDTSLISEKRINNTIAFFLGGLRTVYLTYWFKLRRVLGLVAFYSWECYYLVIIRHVCICPHDQDVCNW